MSNSPERVLVFPANHTEALVYARQRKDLGEPVIGATSKPFDPLIQDVYELILSLPHLSDPDFLPDLRELLARQNITRLVTSQTTVWGLLRDQAQDLGVRLEMISTLPEQTLFKLCREWTHALQPGLDAASWPASTRDQTGHELLLYQALRLPGQSSPGKLLALMRVLACAVPGDMVEVGVLWGRSAWILASLARYFRLGCFLGVDPWPVEGFVQHSPVLDAHSVSSRDFEAIYQTCCAAFWPALAGTANLLRLPSLQAAAQYGASRRVDHPLLGRTDYTGAISLLHLDGNHAQAAVAADLAAWSGFLAPGAWVIIDDYRWAFGDGPQLAADAFCAARQADLALSFELENSLFLKFA